MYELTGMTRRDLVSLIARETAAPSPELLCEAGRIRALYYGEKVFFRGLVEFTNHCAMNCYYCGLRRDNREIARYRMDVDEIIECVRDGYRRGFRSFVLQGGEDGYFASGRLVEVARKIKEEMPDAALTLSAGELPREMLMQLRVAGADRYLLRHETANSAHFAQLHPRPQTLARRMKRLLDLRDAGFQVGAGFMVGSRGQTAETLADDLLFLMRFKPDMVGVGPFLPQSQTPFAGEPPGALAATLAMIALVRIALPSAMMPATTALGTLVKGGREAGLRAGANVVMPNLTPSRYRGDYLLYDGKIGVDDGVEEGLARIDASIRAAGFLPDYTRGDPQKNPLEVQNEHESNA